MKILDVLTSPWAIRQEKMAEIRNLYLAHLRDPKLGPQETEARLGLVAPGKQDKELYQVMNGVAVLPIKGVLTKESSFFSWFFGGVSMKQLALSFQAALDDAQVRSILLDIDSPGGTVDGTEELAAAIFAARGQKPVIAYSDGMIASAAYWIASAADEIYISGDTVMVGSIGVLATHIDQSKADEAWGEKWTEITAGKFKRIASAHAPLTDAGAAYLQGQVDYLYDIFLGAVARNRGVERDAAQEMADGKIFIGGQAVEVGLVDGVESFSDLINSAEFSAGHHFATQKEEIMNLEELKTKHPELVAQVAAEGKAAGLAEAAAAATEAGIEQGRAEGAAAERQRIAAVLAQAIPGHEALIEEMVSDGKTTGPEAAMRIVSAERTIAADRMKALKADGALGVEQPAAPVLPAPAARGRPSPPGRRPVGPARSRFDRRGWPPPGRPDPRGAGRA